MVINFFFATGGLWGLAGVLAHALSSHPIKPRLEANGTLDSFNLAANFMLFHGIALLFVGLACFMFPKAGWQWAGLGWIVGGLLFQGSIFAKSFLQIGSLGLATPIGGMILMLTWVYVIITGFRISL